MTEQEINQVHAGVQRTIACYARAMDGRDLQSCVALFTEDAVIEVMGQRYAGVGAIRGWMNELAKSPPGIHLTTNTVVQAVSADEATAISDVAFIKRLEGGWQILAAGKYEDQLRRNGSQWQFIKRTIVLT
jgi:ketosteroid isomerase-like protein